MSFYKEEEIEIGKKYFHLIVIEEIEPKISATGKTLRQWKCSCDCGSPIKVKATAFKLSMRKAAHCGCDPIEVERTNLVGQKFNRLTVVERSGTKKNKKSSKIMWKCKCDCGNIVYADTTSLRGGHTGSCGCYFKDCMKERNRNNKTYNIYDLESYEYGVGYTIKGEPYYFDKEDFDKIYDYKWIINDSGHVQSHTRGGNSDDRKTVLMHQIIMETQDVNWTEWQVDHIDCVGYDNRKSNLRIVKPRENAMNKKPQVSNKSGVTGVNFHKIANKFIARINIGNDIRLDLGKFSDFTDAVRARIEAEVIYYGDYMHKNNLNILQYINSGKKLKYGSIDFIEKIRKGGVA